jgi:hypothetical protein
MREPATPSFGEPERAAWSIVLSAIDAAMDVDGLGPYDRGRLAELHERAAWHIGVPALVIPLARATPSACGAVREPGGVYELGQFGVDADTLAVLAYRGGIRRVDDIEGRTDGELLGIQRIGPKRLASIRAAVRRYRSGHDR